jgi:hypothetical protein
VKYAESKDIFSGSGAKFFHIVFCKQISILMMSSFQEYLPPAVGAQHE